MATIRTKRSGLLLAVLVMVGGGTMLWRFGTNAKWDLDSIAPPWGARPSIHDHVRAHLPEVGVGLRAGGAELPDEALARGESGVGWVAGGLDGAFGHHGAADDGGKQAAKLFASLERALSAPTQKNVHAFYAAISSAKALEAIDPLLEKISKSELPEDRLNDLALWLTERAPDREPVKFGIAILGLFSGTEHHELLKLLGRHEEFTLYASVALANSEPAAAERNLFELAKHVDGWGRIQIVERLAETEDRTIQRWLVRHGYRNSVMYEYLAYTCAVRGKLREELTAAAIDEELLRGAGDIISALIAGQGGPAEGIDDYSDAAVVVTRYLDHLELALSSIEQLLVVSNIHAFVNDEKANWTARVQHGWSPEVREKLRKRTAAIIAQPRWKQHVQAELAVEDDVRFARAAAAAGVLGLDAWEAHFERTKAGKSHWWALMQSDDVRRIERVVALAEEKLPLDEIASGPASAVGIGPKFRPHMDLDSVVQDLHRFPGMGWTLIKTALQSPSIRNRNLAIKALADWGKPRWPSDAETIVVAAIAAEPDEEVRQRLQRLLAGQPVDSQP